MADNTASGIPLNVVDIQAETLEQEAPKVASRKGRSTVSVSPEVEEVTAVSVRHSVDEGHEHEEDELDDIIDAVLQALQERREGKSSSRRAARQAELAGPTALANPSPKTNKILIYTGIGVGAVAVVGGLWWYFKKK